MKVLNFHNRPKKGVELIYPDETKEILTLKVIPASKAAANHKKAAQLKVDHDSELEKAKKIKDVAERQEAESEANVKFMLDMIEHMVNKVSREKLATCEIDMLVEINDAFVELYTKENKKDESETEKKSELTNTLD